MFRPKSITVILAVIFCSVASADEQTRFDVSRAWFKPELLMSNQPEICEPVFRSYVDYFVSSETSNPLKPISARYDEKHIPSQLTETIRELDWESVGQDEKKLRVATWRQDGKYFGIVEHGQAIGWRPATYSYYLIDKPLSEADIADSTRESFGPGPFYSVRETGSPGLFDVIYASDSRAKSYEQNTYVQVANVYSVKNRTYLSLLASKSHNQGATIQLIASVVSPRQIKLVCKFTTIPSSDAINSESMKIPHYREFEEAVWKIMGGGGDCGTMNSPARAANDLRAGFSTLMFRPWTRVSSVGNYGFEAWAYSGAWNYRKYLEFNASLAKTRQSLADKYSKDYRLDRSHALQVADFGISTALARGFSHGDTEIEDREFQLKQALLEGRPVEKVLPLLPKQEPIKDADNDGLLVFAIGHPRLVELLLKNGFDPNRVNAFGKSPLMYAAQFNDLESAKLLVKHGANTELATTQPLDSCNYTIETHRVTALHYAVRYASRDFIAWLVGAGAVTAAKDSRDRTPLDYLTKPVGFEMDKRNAKVGYDKQNSLLTKAQVESLAVMLTPLAEGDRQSISDEENRKAESLYQSGKIQEAYVAIKRSLSQNPKNERALSNLSLIALRLGYHGESAKAATYVVKNGRSEKERASAYFNLALACEAEGKNRHYATISYDGASYCSERWDRYQGPLYYYLKSYQTDPTSGRAGAIVDFLEKADAEHGKWLCKASDPQSNMRSVYVAMNNIYFLGKTGTAISYQRFAGRDRGNDKPIEIKQREEFSLENGFTVTRWEIGGQQQGAVVLGDQLCGRLLPILIQEKTELVELLTDHRSKTIAISAGTSKPVVLALYGDKTNWIILAGSENIVAVYVHGTESSLQYPRRKRAVVHLNTKPSGGNFESNLKMGTGLDVSTSLRLKDVQEISLNDETLLSFPLCGGTVRASCRSR